MFIKYIKKIIMASFLLYAFNMVAIHFNILIPLNLWTIGFVSFFDLPGILILLILKTIGV